MLAEGTEILNNALCQHKDDKICLKSYVTVWRVAECQKMCDILWREAKCLCDIALNTNQGMAYGSREGFHSMDSIVILL